MNITFWKDNLLSGEHEVDIEQIIREFLETEESKWDMPFERLILNFMSIKYGSFDVLSDKSWNALHDEWSKQRKAK